jgi:hypothetical protein
MLFYTTVKCVYDQSFHEATFFWALDTRHPKNSLSHMAIPLFLIRRVVIVFSVGIAGENPLYCIFLVLIVNMLIIFNNIINSPYKRHGVMVVVKEVLFTTVIILLGAQTIFSLDSKQSWMIGLATAVIVLFLVLVGVWVTVRETWRVVQKIYLKGK